MLISGVLFFLNSSLQKEYDQQSSQLKELEKSISQRQENKNIQAYELFQKHTKTLKEKTHQSNIPRFIHHFRFVRDKYNIEFNGFNYSDGVMTTGVTALSNETGNAYIKTTKFMEKYRQDESALFDLSFISQVSGHTNQKYGVEFRLKK